MNDAAASSVAPVRYALSFTTGTLLAHEAALLAPLYAQHRDWEKVRRLALESNVLQVRTHSTGIRLVRETVKRLSVLTDDEVSLVTEVTASERSHLMWAAACRRYELIGEFAEEVLHERFLLLAPTLDHQDFDGFVRSKALWHEELVEIRDSTLRKLRSNVFGMLKEAGLLSVAGRIMPALLSERLSVALSSHTPSDLRFFPIRAMAGEVTAL
ncbi:DUF1819 family protein [Tessaracoccus flavescens]|uniref:DUF1819 domain-containing protein n=1 Tax=Tessaracoccus flavescens TaxID=399497 RepID=A0A1Q2CW25_9ACTN|nr:DUF1819 family protein [Tessaracoccus flavescens]AQP50318.1 hypothetical protein BW733_05205 [Tessaracoccus flavescens]